MLEARQLDIAEPLFGLQAAGRMLAEALAPWVQNLGLLVEAVEAGRPPGAPTDWQPGAVLRLPAPDQLRREGAVCAPALTALADAAMMVACAAAWNGYRPMTPIDQTMHFLGRVTCDVVADARVVRVGRTASFGRVMLFGAIDKRPVGMVASAYAIV
jgi:acyl-coenzyme A thioesterase PaaI-like protein